MTLKLSTPDLPRKERVLSAIKEIHNLGIMNPWLPPGEEVIIDGVKVQIHHWEGDLWIREIYSVHQGLKRGTRVLKQIIEIAEKYCIDIRLNPSLIGNTSINRLIRWYLRHGFVLGEYADGTSSKEELVYRHKSNNYGK